MTTQRRKRILSWVPALLGLLLLPLCLSRVFEVVVVGVSATHAHLEAYEGQMAALGMPLFFKKRREPTVVIATRADTCRGGCEG